MVKESLNIWFIIFTGINVIANFYTLLVSFLLLNKFIDSQADNTQIAITIFSVITLLFTIGVVLLFLHKRVWANIAIAVPVIVNVLYMFF